MSSKSDNLIWIDLEMTGLDPDKDRIIEIATIVTDSHLNILATGPMLAIHQPIEEMNAMDEWCTKQHGKSGLTARVSESQIDEKTAEAETLAFLKQHVAPQKSPMCGNSICQDRRFLYRWMPTLAVFFHYRNLDVSTLKELAKRWAPEVYKGHHKQSQHLALEDIKDSINELIFYRSNFIQLPEDENH